MTTAVLDQNAKIREIVCRILELEADEVADGDHLQDDHGADSMGAIEILAAIEKEFSVVIDQAEMTRMTTLEGIYTVTAEAAHR